LGPVTLLREDNTVKVRYLDTGAEVGLDASRPVQILNSVTANDDETYVEVANPT
jgi:hypothetical protein